MRSGWTPELEIETRRPDSAARVFIDAEIEVAADLRRRKAQWQLADGVVLRAHDFPAGNVLDAAAETMALTLADAPAGNHLYTVHWSVVINPIVPGAGVNTHTVVIAIDTRPAAGVWTERVALKYEVKREPGQNATQVRWGHETEAVRVTGMTATHEIRIRIKSAAGPGGWSFAVHGFNVATDGDATQGVDYHTGRAVDFYADGGVGLADLAETKIENVVSDGFMTDLGGPPMLPARSPYVMALYYPGAGTPSSPIDRFVAWLNPRIDGGQPRNVTHWVCQPFEIHIKDGSGRLDYIAPLATAVTVPAQEGDAAEDITFSWAKLDDALKPKVRGGTNFYLFYVWAMQADGSPATNVGMGQDSATVSVISGARTLQTARIEKLGSFWFHTAQGPTLPVLRCRIEGGNYPATETIPFTGAGAGSRFDLGVVPTKTVQFVCHAEPNGGSAVFQVRNDGDTAWVTVTDGQTTDDLGLAKNQTRKAQVILTAAPNLDATPVVVEFGMRELETWPLHHCARLQQAQWAVDPLQLVSETTNATIVALREDLAQEFTDRTTELLTKYFIGQITLRAWWGTPERPRWMPIDDFLIDDKEFRGPEVGIPCLGKTVLERGQLPVFDHATQSVEPLVYANTSIKTAYDDILARIGVSARHLGPGLEDTATLVTKTLTDSEAKAELDALCFVDGSARISSQGRIKAVKMSGPKAVVRTFSKSGIRWSSSSPGYRQRVPEVRVPWNYSEEQGRYLDEFKAAHQGALLRLGRARIDPPQFLPDAATRWIKANTLAERVGNRHVSYFGAGLMVWYFQTEFPEPHLEPGDCVAVPTDRFATRDPTADQPIFGELWALGVVVATSEDFKTFALWVRTYADLLGATAAGTRLGFGRPAIAQVSLSVADTGVVSSIVRTTGAQSVKVASSTVGFPTDATVRAQAAQGTDAAGTLITAALATLTDGQTLYVSALAYELAGGLGAESAIGQAQIAFRNVPTVSILNAGPVWRANRLIVQVFGNTGVNSFKVATSTAAFPAAGTGTVVEGRDGTLDAGTFTYGQTVFVTVTPYPNAAGGGTPGPVLSFRARLAVIDGWFDDVTGKGKRDAAYTDGKFALKASDTAGKETDDDLFIADTKTLKVGTVASPASLTRTIRFDHSQFAPEADFTMWFNDALHVQPRSTDLERLYAPALLPKGVTITKLRGRVFRSDAFPIIESLTETSFGSDSNTHNVSMPATVVAGELLLMLFTSDGTLGHTTPSGWTLIKTLAGTQTRISIYGKVAAGTEGGTTVNVATSAAETAAAQVYRVSQWWGAIAGVEASTGAAASSTTPNPDSLTPSWGSARTLWLAMCSADGAPTITVYPTNYTNGTRTASGGVDQCVLGSARRFLRAATDDPGTFTLGASGAWAALTIAIRPSAAASGDVLDLRLFRSTSDAAASIASVAPDVVGWQTKEASLSQLVGEETYTLRLDMDAADLATDVGLQYAEIEYTRPDYSQVY